MRSQPRHRCGAEPPPDRVTDDPDRQEESHAQAPHHDRPGGALGLVVLTGGAVVVPAVASAAVSPESGTADEIAERVTAIRDALAGLVSGGTITPEQADAVAQWLAEDGPRLGSHRHGHGGRHLSLDTAAETLGVTEDELRDALRGGDTLAEVAEREGVAVDTLVQALVAEARERLAAAVEDGRLTQAEADGKAADLQERITTAVQEGGGFGRGHGPGRGHGRDDADADADADGTQPSPEASTPGSATSLTPASSSVRL